MDPNLVYFLLGLGIAIPVGIFTNLITPKIQEWVNKRPQVSAAKKLKNLQEELDQLTELYNDREKLSLKTTSALFTTLLYFIIGNAVWALPLYFLGEYLQLSLALFAFFFFLIAIIATLNHIRLISKINNFANYRKELETKINNIQGIVTPIQ